VRYYSKGCSLTEFDDVGICDFDFSTPENSKTNKKSGPNSRRSHRKQKKKRIHDLLIHLWPGKLLGGGVARPDGIIELRRMAPTAKSSGTDSDTKGKGNERSSGSSE
jgi:hypothetical protein